MTRKPTLRQKGFVKDYLDTGNATEAVRRNYNVTTINSATSIASENLTKPSIIDMIKNEAEGAFSRIIDLSITAENETVKFNANKDIMDRAGFKAVDKSVSLNINRDISDKINPEIEELRDEYEERLRSKLLNS